MTSHYLQHCLFVLTFALELKDANYKSRWKILVFYYQWKMMSDLNMCNDVWFCFISVRWVHFCNKTVRILNFKSHWNTLLFFDKKETWSQIWICPMKNVWFCFISVVWVHFSYETENFRFWKSMIENIYKKKKTFLIKKDMVSDLNMSRHWHMRCAIASARLCTNLKH